MLASLTGLGLSAAAGLNAYIPLLLVGVLARFTDVLTLPEPYRWIQSGWALAIVSVLHDLTKQVENERLYQELKKFSAELE